MQQGPLPRRIMYQFKGDDFDHITLSVEEWEELVKSGQVEDISDELPSRFLYIYQWMRAKVVIVGKKYLASGWELPNSKPFVNLILVKDDKYGKNKVQATSI